MIFLNKKYTNPEIGDYIIKRKFAWRPTFIKDKIVWLESYESIFVFTRKEIVVDGGSAIHYKKWVLIDRRCKVR